MFKKKSDGMRPALANQLKRASVYIIVAALMIGVFLFLYFNVMESKKDVEVITLSTDVGPGQLITSDMLVKSKKSARDYDENTEIPWYAAEDFVVNKYAAVYIAKDVPLRDTWFMGTGVEKLNYLKEMTANEQLTTIPYDSSYAGGNLLKPGDHIKLYASYLKSDATGREEQKATVEIVFEDATVTDLLNSSKNSILSIIEDAQRLPITEREALMSSDSFQEQLSPRYMMIILKKDQATALKQAMGSAKMQLSADILTRNRPEGQKEIITGNLLSTYLQKQQTDSSSTK
ncbi:hypothetical protein ABGV42_01690 [Paenibacillus pabuli]|uniref:hypothetical protein n=1 Tax=Paenibacillus pabuli TaxID=1472 RepID=UPI003242C760